MPSQKRALPLTTRTPQQIDEPGDTESEQPEGRWFRYGGRRWRPLRFPTSLSNEQIGKNQFQCGLNAPQNLFAIGGGGNFS